MTVFANRPTEAAGADASTLRLARAIVEAEAQALLRMAGELDRDFAKAVRSVADCRGHVILSGIGKAGLIGQKISATLASTGTPSYFLHPSEALHGDLGRLRKGDLIVALSHSGETEELMRFVFHASRLPLAVIAMTGNPHSRLACAANVTLHLGTIREADPLGLAPSTSTTAMLALGDALALTVAQSRGFGRHDFARFHPGGSLGLELAKVDDVMRPLTTCRVAPCSTLARVVLGASRTSGRRSGAILLTDSQDRLVGIFTDSDLARLFEQHRENLLDTPIGELMTKNPRCIESGKPFREALSLLRTHKISELPVVDALGIPLGLIDVTDVVVLLPDAENEEAGVPGPSTLPFPRLARPHS